ncbi:MAG: beta-xylosidase [Verrucomicrobia bacterium]|nr:beta-xylosidase [Verrucomicrobiota bacterium]
MTSLYPTHIVLLIVCLVSLPIHANHHTPDAVIKIDASSNAGEVPTDWAWVGHDEINYAWYPDGRRLLGELDYASQVPMYIRAHNMLNSGTEEPSLKWSATNVYTEDKNGNPVYNFEVIDRIFDTYQEFNFKPMVQFGFMPEALTTGTDVPYERDWPNRRTEGWAFPPNDYDKWAKLVETMVKHWVDKYGEKETLSWIYEPWNEPAGAGFFRGTQEEYNKLYDYTIEAVRRSLPDAVVGGPDVQSLTREHSVVFLRNFLEHCRSGTNHSTGKTGTPLDFIAFHTKGNVAVNEDNLIQMGSLRQVAGVDIGFQIIADFPEYKHLPIVLGESDPEGTAAYSVAERPQNGYRHYAIYPAYMAALNNKFRQSAKRHGVNLEGIVSWAFTFPEKPWFAGYRAFSTHNVDKPVFNYFRMAGMMSGHLLDTTSNHSIALDAVLESGFSGEADIDALAARNGKSITIMVWNYHDLLTEVEPSKTQLSINNLPKTASKVLIEHFIIDDDPNRNTYLAWQAMGSPQSPSDEQIAELQRIGQLQTVDSPRWIKGVSGDVEIDLTLPRPSLSLVRLSW